LEAKLSRFKAAIDMNARHTREVEEKISQLQHQRSTKKV
jgi:predicted sulfurtransferase